MSTGKKLGLFWGSNAFSVIESNQDVPVKNFRVPFQPTEIVDVSQPHTQTDDARLASNLKDALRANKVTLTDVHLALSSKDIVIRSFVVPFLKPNEIKGVVEFEIKKYIPFNLKELVYSFHAAPLIEDKVKRMRVHFVAIRREILEHYNTIMKQAGLNVVFSESAPMCLVRTLITKKYIKPDQKVAVIQTDFTDSRIIIFDSGVVQFVRDFQLHNPALNAPIPDVELLQKKLFNEIKISLDFYMRQFKSEKITEALTISFDPTQDFVEQLQKELEMPVRKIDPSAIVSSPEAQDAGCINAYGAILNPVAKTAIFNFSGPVAPPKPTSIAAALHIPDEYFPAFKVGVISLVLVFGVFILTKFGVAQTKKKHDALVEQVGAFLDMTAATIQQRIDDNNSKLEISKNIFKKTEMAQVLVHLPALLPEGVWLNDLSVQYNAIVEPKFIIDPKTKKMKAAPASTGPTMGLITLDIGGYVYTPDSNQQFRIVYNVVNSLKTDDLFKRNLKNVNLASIQSEQKENVSVTSFKINGK